MEQVLGPDRYQQYLMVNDPSFREATSFAEQSSLTHDKAVTLYNLRKQAEDQYRVIALTSASDADRQEKAIVLSRRAEEQLSHLLDDQNRDAYLQSRAGEWIRVLRSGGSPRRGNSSTGLIMTEHSKP